MLLFENKGGKMTKNKVIITAGQHRNEKGAQILAPLVAERLRKLGYKVKLFENPEKRTPRQIGLEAFREERKIEEKELEKILYQWEDRLYWRYRKFPILNFLYRKVSIFNLHDDTINPTEFVLEEELREELESIEAVYESFDLGDFKGDNLAHKVKFSVGGGKDITIEIPTISQTSLPEDQLEVLEKVFENPCSKNPAKTLFEIYCSYLLDTDIEETKRQGFLSQKMVEILAKGIDYLIKNEYNLE